MRRLVLVNLLLLATAQGQTPVFRSSVDGISVTVSVRQGNSAVVGLPATAFELSDNGVTQTIQAFSVETLPIDVTLLLDLSQSVAGRQLDRLKQSVVETAALLTRDDRIRLIAMQHELRQVFGFQPAGARPPVDQLAAQGGTALYDGLAAAMMRAADPDRRQLIVVGTDGEDTASILPFSVVRDIAGSCDAVLHAVVPTVTDRKDSRAAAGVAAVGEIASRTGGRIFRVDLNAPITDTFARAINEFRTSYVLRYLPTGVKRDGWHEIQVRVKGGSYEVRARKGYSGS
jgi:VWFA-related protein